MFVLKYALLLYYFYILLKHPMCYIQDVAYSQKINKKRLV